MRARHLVAQIGSSPRPALAPPRLPGIRPALTRRWCDQQPSRSARCSDVSGPASIPAGARGTRAAGGAEVHPRCERSERCEESHPWAEPARPAVTGGEEDAPALGPGSGTPSTARRIGGRREVRRAASFASFASSACAPHQGRVEAGQPAHGAACQVSAGRPAVGTEWPRTRPCVHKASSARVIASAGGLGRAARRGRERLVASRGQKQIKRPQPRRGDGHARRRPLGVDA